MKRKQKVLVIVGPTSAGKSALAVELARKFDGEVISADSRQVYKGLDRGTGKITKREMKGVPHHLLDVVSPKSIFTAQNFIEHAQVTIDNIARRGKLPIVAGGTGFYIDALLGRIILPDAAIDPKLRATLGKKTVPVLFRMLKKRDPRRAKTVEPHNKRRLIRALEITTALGRVPGIRKPMSSYDAVWIGMTLQRKVIEAKIAARLRARLKGGMVAEARQLRRRGLSLRRMRQLGLEYRALADHLEGTLSRADLEETLLRDIRRYAKRQIAYWRRNKEIAWYGPSQKRQIAQRILRWIQK